MAFVQKLGERYLWIDALCIIQDDEPRKARQLAQMDLVYSRACLTLIAATSLDANEGLRGVDPSSRLNPFARNYINDSRVVIMPESLENILRDSKYSNRAWTMQEQYLSPRSVHFTNHRAYFSCHEDLYSDHTNPLLFHQDEERRSKPNWFLDSLTSEYKNVYTSPGAYISAKFSLYDAFLCYTKLVEESTPRALTYKSDAINAVLGMLTLLSKALGPCDIAGLPSKYLDHMILWRTQGPRRERNAYFELVMGWMARGAFI
jgi:hypothetical protein